MTLKRFAYGALGATILGTGLMLGMAEPASAACRGGVFAGSLASGNLRILVERRARLNWTTRARAVYGREFSNWYVARNRNMNCNRVRPSNRWNCVARGQACDRSS